MAASAFDDELWELVPDDDPEPAAHLAKFVLSLDGAGAVLDLGCGDGRLTRLLRADQVTAADVSVVALERAARRAPGVLKVRLEPDAKLPFSDASFDLVLCAETLEHVRDSQLFLSEIRRVLRPRGTLALTTPGYGRRTALQLLIRGFESGFHPFSPHLRFYTARSLSNALRSGGFRLISLDRKAGTLLALAAR